MTHPLQSLIDAPLADATKKNVPSGKRATPRGSKSGHGDEIGFPKVSGKELRERKAKAAAEKLGKLFDYYAATDMPAERVAEHMGLYRQEQAGTDAKGKPTFSRVLDVKRAEEQLSWRRAQAA